MVLAVSLLGHRWVTLGMDAGGRIEALRERIRALEWQAAAIKPRAGYGDSQLAIDNVLMALSLVARSLDAPDVDALPELEDTVDALTRRLRTLDRR